MKSIHTKSNERGGATIFLMLALLVLVFIFIAFTIDLGRVQLAQLKLQVASDFATRAGAEAMSRGVVSSNASTSDLEDALRDEVDMVMKQNTVFGTQVDFNPETQIEFGQAVRVGQKFTFTASGSMNHVTNSLRVDPNMNQFPMLFGGFTGRDSSALSSATTAKVKDRDIVLVIDRSGSMFAHDAGTVVESGYNANLRAVEDALYDNTHPFHPDNTPSISDHTEFDVAGGVITLSRIQAIKLAILKFRQEIDRTRANEKLGLTSYETFATQLSDVVVEHNGTSNVDILNGLTAAEFNSITQTNDDEEGKHCACQLMNQNNSYAKFDFQYLRMRCGGATHIADGILRGTDILFGSGRRSFATPILIVMTDGNHNQASTPEAAASSAIAAHPDMLIYTVTFGTGANQTSMQNVASTGNGAHIHCDDVNELVDAFQNLATNAGVIVIE